MNGWIKVTDDGAGFLNSQTNERFVPMGCNYFDPTTGWPFHNWTRYNSDHVARQLEQIGQSGLNCVRVFLESAVLNPAPGQFSDEGFAKVDDMVGLAEKSGLRIIFSGPNFNEGTADHRQGGDVYGDPRQLEYCCDLWRKLGERYGQNPTVMTWDLYNEPQVFWSKPEHSDRPHVQPRLERWRQFAKTHLGADPGPTFPSSHVNGYSRELYRCYVAFLEYLGEDWVAQQCQAIRGSGSNQLITVGLIQWSCPIMLPKGLGYAAVNPRKVAKHLDYMSEHFYPIVQSLKAGIDPEFDLQKTYLQVVARSAYIPGKPLVIEEFGWKGGPAVPGEVRAYPEEHQTQWCDTLIQQTQQFASGWLNWAYADSPAPNADVSAASGLWTSDESKLKHWGRRFLEWSRQLQAAPPQYRPADVSYDLDLGDYMFEQGGHPGYDWLKAHAQETAHKTIEVKFKDV